MSEKPCPQCSGEGFVAFEDPEDWGCKTLAGEERAYRRYLKQFTEDGRCRHCNGSGETEGT